MGRTATGTTLRARAARWSDAQLGIDTRALAALRIALGVIILMDLAYRSFNLVAFYTDQGAFPRAALQEHSPILHLVSLHALSGATGFQVVLFLVAAVLAVALVLGYRTRMATLLSCILLASLLARNPFILNSGDSLLLLLLFWGIFLPLGARWSLDAARAAAPETRTSDLATAGILVQVVLIYVTNAVFKLRADAWVEGTAMRQIFSMDRYTTPPGRLLAHFPELLTWLGWLWLTLLALSFLLLALRGLPRLVLVLAFMGIHVGMLLTMRLGLFPLVSLAALLPFLPPLGWDRFEERVVAPLNRRTSRFARMPGLTPSLAAVLPRGARGHDARPAARPLAHARAGLLAIALAVMLLWSGIGLGYANTPAALQDTLGRHERGWAMFATPGQSNIWYVFPGALADGGEIDAFHGGPVDWDTERFPDSLFPEIRWHKFLAVLTSRDGPDVEEHLASYLCARWNTVHEPPLVEVAIHRVKRPVLLDGPDPPSTAREIGRYTCAP